jgi:hypothetical protein
MFYASFTASKVGKTGLTVTVDVHRVTRSSGASSEVVTAAAMAEIGDGVYSYRLASADLTLYDYVAIAKTADTSVDQQNLAALWTNYATGAAIAGDAMTLSAGAVTAAAIATDAIDSDALAATATAEIAAAAWAYATRTLTASSSGADITTETGHISRKRGDTWGISITGLGALTGYTSLWFTIKTDPSHVDSASIVQIKLNATGLLDGLLYVNGAAASNEALGSITIDDLAAGNITIALDESITASLPIASGLYYDVQTLISAATNTPDSGSFDIVEDITRSIT